MSEKIDNMEFWNKAKTPPGETLSPITGGNLKGKTDISPMWRMQVMTEYYGQCGVGWRYEIIDKWVMECSDSQVMCFVQINLYTADPEMKDGPWSASIPGIGGSFLIEYYKTEKYVKSIDDGYKMAVTDALGVCMKALGVAADVYMGKMDGGGSGNNSDSKYSNQSNKTSVSEMPLCVNCNKNNDVMTSKYPSSQFYCHKCKEGFDVTVDINNDIIQELIGTMGKTTIMSELTEIWNKNKPFQQILEFKECFHEIKANIEVAAKKDESFDKPATGSDVFPT